MFLFLQKVMHTRKRHMELFQELNQKFQTLDRFRDVPKSGSMVSFPSWILEICCVCNNNNETRDL